MSRADWISCALSEEARGRLSRDLRSVLPGRKERRDEFIEAAGEEIDAYNKLTLPAARDADLRETRLERLRDAGRAFVAALAAVDPDLRDRLEISIMMEARKQGVRPGATIEIARASMRAIDDAGKVAARLGDTAEEAIRKLPRRRPKADRRSLVGDIAFAYARIFREQPSAAREGIFSRALRAVLKEAQIEIPPGEAWLAGVIATASVAGFPPPRRGRKSTSANT